MSQINQAWRLACCLGRVTDPTSHPEMKRYILSYLWLAAGLAALAAAGAGAQECSVTTSAGFNVSRGVNLSHWLSQTEGCPPRATFITEKDIAFIAHIGYDHVRIPIDEAEMWGADGKIIEESMGYLTRCLDWCGKFHLRAIVDLHILRSHYFNAVNEGGPRNSLWTDPAAQDNFVRLWADLSARLRRYPVDQVAYELMNEPVAPEPEDWNRLVAKVMTSLRAREPNRVVVIGANLWQIPSSLPDLEVPAGDRNIILSFHTYAPMFFTHHTASWTAFKTYTGPVQYPGLPVPTEALDQYAKSNATNREVLGPIAEARHVFNKDRLVGLLQPAIRQARKLNLPLYCGEFGCLPRVKTAERLRYYDDLISAFEENHIAWCNWEYKGDFGIFRFDSAGKVSPEPDTPLIRVMMRDRGAEKGS
jgi:endoglucanase